MKRSARKDLFTAALPFESVVPATAPTRAPVTAKRSTPPLMRSVAPPLVRETAAEWWVAVHCRTPATIETSASRGIRFTPRVSLEAPDALLLEVRGSVALFGGVPALLAQIQAEFAPLRPCLALAPTPLAAVVLARACAALSGEKDIPREPVVVLERSSLVSGLAKLPLGLLRFPEEAVIRLRSIGVRSIGQALRLPRTGFARRFGVAQLEALDRLVGRRPEPRRAVNASERFRSRIEPGFELSDAQRVLAYVQPALLDLERFLRNRQAGITALDCRFHHREQRFTRCTLRFAQPAFEAPAIAALLTERMTRVVLPAPVMLCELRSGQLVSIVHASTPLWGPGEHGGGVGSRAVSLLERLRARLGETNVQGLELVPEHRPEFAWRHVEPDVARANPALRSEDPARDERPLWLLDAPLVLASRAGRPRYEGKLELVGGPERLETGWWDAGGIARDYYVAQDERGAKLWIFRERAAEHRWFLHGVFG